MPDRDLMQGWKPGLSGTEPQAMLDQLTEARSAVIAAMSHIWAIDINARDYDGRARDLSADIAARLELAGMLQDVSERLMAAAIHVANRD